MFWCGLGGKQLPFYWPIPAFFSQLPTSNGPISDNILQNLLFSQVEFIISHQTDGVKPGLETVWGPSPAFY